MRVATLVGAVGLAAAAALASGACTTKEPTQSTYFGRIIAPTLQTTCVRANTGAGCHVADTRGNAFGNLDLSSYAGVNARRDLLLDYGPYLQPALLVKNVPPFQLTIQLWDSTTEVVTTDIKHAGGPIFDPTASDYQTLRHWIENGATVNNTGVAPQLVVYSPPCTHVVPTDPRFDPTTDPLAPDFVASFAGQNGANGVLQTSCVAGNCHGTTVNALYLTCGQTPQEIRWNYFAAVDYLASTAEASEIVRRPLATSQGGSYHEGGPIFSTVTDPEYVALKTWAAAALTNGPRQPSTPLDAGFLFFAHKVQPILAKKGCMMVQCHSAAMFHEYRLRGGSAGSFSLHTSQRNYAFSVGQMSFESDDVNASRLVRKNLYRPDAMLNSGGIAHRGGALLEDFGKQLASGSLCDAGGDAGAGYDYDNGNLDAIPAYCVIREWHKRERALRKPSPLSAIVYVSRPIPAGPDGPQDFDVFAGGASMHIAAATLTATGDVTLGTDAAVDVTGCGLGGTPDLRRPAVSWDASEIAFAGRATPSDPLAIYVMHADGTMCVKQADIAMHAASSNGRLIHDFDPAFSPPGLDGTPRIVFASTRGNLTTGPSEFSGPQGTPSNPAKPNANLYVLEPSPLASGMQVRQLTYQLNMERMPSFMSDGRLIFTAEKREPGFYQLALRRQNLDGGDYHPLYAQRGSVGYPQATYAVELADRNFASIFSQTAAKHGAGAVAVFNRSIGPDFTSTTPSDYLVDPAVITPGSPSAPEPDFFLHSLDVVASDGSYTSPAPLPDGKMLVSYGGAADPASFGGDYDVYVMDPVTGQKTKLLGATGTAEVEAVAVYARIPKGIFGSALDEVNGHTYVDTPAQGAAEPTTAEVTVLDVPVLASLLFQNTPTGRLLENDLTSFELWEDVPPDVTTFPAGGNTVNDGLGPTGMVYVRRRRVGSVPVLADGSAHFLIPGGLPLVLHLPDDAESRARKLPRWQREEMTFVPGEHTHQGLSSAFFNNLCGTCHGSISGRPLDASLRTDFMTQASAVEATKTSATDCSGSRTGAPIVGPPSGL